MDRKDLIELINKSISNMVILDSISEVIADGILEAHPNLDVQAEDYLREYMATKDDGHTNVIVLPLVWQNFGQRWMSERGGFKIQYDKILNSYILTRGIDEDAAYSKLEAAKDAAFTRHEVNILSSTMIIPRD